MGLKETFEIVQQDGKHVIKCTYSIDEDAGENFYYPYSDSDEIQFASFEHVKKLAQTDGNYTIKLREVKSVLDTTSSEDYITGGRFDGYVARRVDVESRPNYGGPCYFARLEMHTNRMHPESADFSFNARSKFATPKAKKNAQEVLTNLLLDILQLKKKVD